MQSKHSVFRVAVGTIAGIVAVVAAAAASAGVHADAIQALHIDWQLLADAAAQSALY